MNRFSNILRRICAIVAGLVFFASGVLKLMDPVGSGLIVNEYFKFFHAGFLSGISLPAGFLVSLLEAVAGVALVTGVYRKAAAVVIAAMMAFFTVLTALLWIFNPVMDCGCFGEAVHLTHAQSFLKNIVLIGLLCAAFLPLRESAGAPVRKKISFWVLSVSVLGAGLFSLMVHPMTDFTQFNLSSKLLAAGGETGVPEYVSLFIYEKNGEEGAFTLDSLPDSTWTYVRTETSLKRDNIEETHYPELPVKDAGGNYRDSLAVGDRVLVVSSYRPDKFGAERWAHIADFIATASGKGFSVLLLSATTPERFESMLPESLSEEQRDCLMSSSYYSDYKTLIALNRSNGGVAYFHNGNLIDRWAVHQLPGENRLQRIVDRDATELMISSNTRSRLAFQAFFLYSVAIMLLL